MPEMFPSFHEGEETTHAGSQHGLCTKGSQGNFISPKYSLGLHVISNQFHSKIISSYSTKGLFNLERKQKRRRFQMSSQ